MPDTPGQPETTPTAPPAPTPPPAPNPPMPTEAPDVGPDIDIPSPVMPGTESPSGPTDPVA